MTRKIALEMTRFEYNVSCDVQCRSIINTVYDDIENRLCKNCEWYNRIGVCVNEESLVYNNISVDDFGCNCFGSIQ